MRNATKLITGYPDGLVKGRGLVPFASMLALNPEVAVAANLSSSFYEQRTGAAATTETVVGSPVGSAKNWGTLAGWLAAATDAARPILRSAVNGRKYLETDGVNDGLIGNLLALRNAPGVTIILGIRMTGNGAPFFISTTNDAATRIGIFRGVSGTEIGGRRLNADGFQTSGFAVNSDEDMVLSGIADFTNTDAFIMYDGVTQASNLSFLTVGNTPNDGGHIGLMANGRGNTNFVAGRLYSALMFPRGLYGVDFNLALRWTAEQMGHSL
jgi:hypothetical protein